MESLSIKAARTERNYFQSELAELLGISTRAYVDWENGGVVIKPYMIYAIAYVLEMDADQIRVPVKQ